MATKSKTAAKPTVKAKPNTSAKNAAPAKTAMANSSKKVIVNKNSSSKAAPAPVKKTPAKATVPVKKATPVV